MHVVGKGLDRSARGFPFHTNAADVCVEFVVEGVIQIRVAVFCAKNQMDDVFGERLAHGAILSASFQDATLFYRRPRAALRFALG